ncbi:carbohydrate ABC transporter permease [Anaerocaecibacter muris]|uniref:carbohydrate ABC transporter permease n=1 Tax=Anaerocaecibacter muris TaxID=2941513 RepID=UPI003F68F909
MKKILFKILRYFIVLAVIFIILFPIIWMLPAAFKGKQEIWAIPNTFFPKQFTWQNFIKVFNLDHNGYNFIRSLLMTMLVATLSVVGSLTVNMFAAYAFARLEFRGKKVLWVYFIMTMFIPGITILLTSIRVVSFLHMTDTIFVLVLPGLVSGYNIFFFRQFYLGMPASLEEAAAIEGCSPFKIFIKIFLPMSVTPMVIIGVSVFMGYWNSFMWPTLTIIDNPNLAQVMQVIRVLKSSFAGEYGIVIAATLLAIAPPLVIFAIFQKKIVAGIAISGLK